MISFLLGYLDISLFEFNQLIRFQLQNLLLELLNFSIFCLYYLLQVQQLLLSNTVNFFLAFELS